MARVSDWNFFDQNVQSGLLEGRYMNAAFTMLAAGPPRLAATGIRSPGSVASLNNDLAYPIGVLQSVNLGINSQIMRLWEIGSERSYFIRGRTTGQVALGRIMYHGPSILRALYAYIDTSNEGFGEQLYPNDQNANLNTKDVGVLKQTFKLPPGYKNIWMDLASDVFSQPIGLLLYMKDSNESTVGAFFLEYCMVANYGWTTDAGGTIISENAAVLYERMVPINIQGTVDLIADSADLASPEGITNVIGSAAGPAFGSN